MLLGDLLGNMVNGRVLVHPSSCKRSPIGVHGLADELAVTLHTDSTGLNRSWPRTIPTHPRDRPGRFLDAGTRTSYAGGARCHLRILVHGPLRSYAY